MARYGSRASSWIGLQQHVKAAAAAEGSRAAGSGGNEIQSVSQSVSQSVRQSVRQSGRGQPRCCRQWGKSDSGRQQQQRAATLQVYEGEIRARQVAAGSRNGGEINFVSLTTRKLPPMKAGYAVLCITHTLALPFPSCSHHPAQMPAPAPIPPFSGCCCCCWYIGCGEPYIGCCPPP